MEPVSPPPDTNNNDEPDFAQSLAPRPPVDQPTDSLRPDLRSSMSAPTSPASLDAGAAAQKSDPKVLVLQWLTYAFWGWVVLTLSFLTGSVIQFFVGDSGRNEMLPYGIAAVLVLLPIALVCDKFYSKYESGHKSGPSLAIMIIHAVIFALLAVGSLIGAVFIVVNILVSAESVSGNTWAWLLSAVIIFAYYAATFLRTLNPDMLAWFTKLYRLIMLISVGVIIVLGIVGPIYKERTLSTDRLLERSLGDIPRSIEKYANDNGRLPDNLSDLPDLKEGAKTIVDKNLVEYRKLDGASDASMRNLFDTLGTEYDAISRQIYYYELCATFKEESEYYSGSSRFDSGSTYSTYLSAYSHPAGRQCYKMNTGY